MSYFPTLSYNSRVWIYPASRELTLVESEVILNELKPFVQSWDSHGTPLKADVIILENQFVVIGVDEDIESPSGCSIDRSVKKMKELGQQLSIDFFNRLKMVVKNNIEKKTIAYSSLGDYSEWNIFNPLVKTVNELNESFLIPVKESGLLV
jgi:hypothetical protein